MDSNLEIGCCGAYCRTCREFAGKTPEGRCKGCKIGYDTGERDIARAKCKIKLCCFRDKGYSTCADCSEFDGCGIVETFYGKGRKRYQKSIRFIRENGYKEFLDAAKDWRDSCGRL